MRTANSISTMLEVVRHIAGEELISAVQEVLSCDKLREALDVSVVAIDLDPTLPEALKLALELMHNNIEEPVDVGEISRYVGISKRHLERLFCRHVKATPPRYYMELRLTRARQLLQQANKSLTEVSVACGFKTLSHFHRCFRQLFGMGPREFRESNRYTA
ncbi:helix-turn-helix domain-containing protein [Zestomonas carbonaria]|nr:helix-turn-helix domain-containing protein [Pseudomonas carbonaria]